ncbi:MAG: tetratricopeptide repeat protein [Verrucomicrobiales bacterium]|nr:tetratricopeptide repeat protein [Verrucomicrobiales bacterium]
MALLQPKKSLSITTALLVAFTFIKVSAEESDNETPESQKKEILETIKKIGSDNFKIRESATQKLWKFGKSAEPLLRDALKNGGPELRYRGTKILEEFELGLYPDTPEDIAKLINDYRSGVGVKKEAAIIKMAELGKTELLMKLIKRENDIGIRKMVAQIVSRNISEQVPSLILENKIDEAGQLLEVAALDHNGMRNYASFLVETNQIESAISKKRIAAKNSNLDAEILAWMLRAKGDYQEAATIFEQLGDKTRARHSLSAGGDLISYANSFVDPTRKTIDSLGFSAAAARLSGDMERFNRIKSSIEEYAMAMKDELGRCINALVINGEAIAAFSLTKKVKGKEIFDMELWRYNFDEAFNSIGIQKKKGPYSKWLQNYESSFKAKNEGELQESLFPVGQLASACYITGQIDEAERILEKIKEILIRKNNSLIQLIQWERMIGLNKLAKRHALEAMKREPPEEIVEGYFQLRAEYSWLGRTCWKFITSEYPNESSEQKLSRMESLFDLENQNENQINLADQCIKSFFSFAKDEKNLAMKKELIRGARDLARLHEKWELTVDATKLWLELIGGEAVGYHFMKYGDVLMKAGMPEKAVIQYDKACESKKSDPIPLYLKGVAMEAIGQKEEGQKLKKIASLISTGELTKRHHLATTMWQNEDDALARIQDNIILGIASPRESVHPEALRRRYFDQSINSKDLKQYSKSLEFYMLSKMRPVNANSVLSPRRSLSYLVDLEITKTKIEISDGRIKDAERRLEELQKINPSDSSMLEDIYQLLVDGGNSEGADKLFQTTYSISKSTVNRFPDHGQHNNNHAWLLSRCAKNLDEALAHANKAVSIDPDNGAFLDTLAEVYFQLGDRTKAIEISKKAVELLDGDKQVKRQLERFKTGKPTDR